MPHIATAEKVQMLKSDEGLEVFQGGKSEPHLASSEEEQGDQSHGMREAVQTYLDTVEEENLIPRAFLDELWQ